MKTAVCNCEVPPCNCGGSNSTTSAKNNSGGKKPITNATKLLYATGIALGLYTLLHFSGVFNKA